MKQIVPYSLRDAPALIEKLLPVQKLSAEAYKEQMAGSGKTLTALGNYWKGRKPLILAKACVLGCLLPATDDLERDLEIFEMLMGMDAVSLEKRLEEKNSKESRFILAQERSVGQDAPYREWVGKRAGPRSAATTSTTPFGTRSTRTWAQTRAPSPSWWSSSASCASAIGRAWPTPSAAPARSPSRPRGWGATSTRPT